MNSKFFALTVATVAVMGLAACEHAPWSPANKAPGVYKSETSSTNAQGTKTTTKQTTSVYRDGSGDKKAVVKTETTRDPEGLFNKEKSTSVKTYN